MAQISITEIKKNIHTI